MNYKLKQILLWTLILLGGWANTTLSSELPKVFLKGVECYKSGDFPCAIDAFLMISNNGIKNGKLYYNLGNAYLKNGDLGPAMLWYERALTYNPKDPDLKFNYEYALSKLKDEQENQIRPLYRILFFWKYLLEANTVKWLAVTFNFLFWTLLMLNRLQKRIRLKTSLYLTLIFSIIFAGTAFFNFYASAHRKYGIILPDKISVRSGLTKDTTELFTLHAGTKITVDKALNGYFRITFSNAKIGWIEKSAVGII